MTLSQILYQFFVIVIPVKYRRKKHTAQDQFFYDPSTTVPTHPSTIVPTYPSTIVPILNREGARDAKFFARTGCRPKENGRLRFAQRCPCQGGCPRFNHSLWLLRKSNGMLVLSVHNKTARKARNEETREGLPRDAQERRETRERIPSYFFTFKCLDKAADHGTEFFIPPVFS